MHSKVHYEMVLCKQLGLLYRYCRCSDTPIYCRDKINNIKQRAKTQEEKNAGKKVAGLSIKNL